MGCSRFFPVRRRFFMAPGRGLVGGRALSRRCGAKLAESGPGRPRPLWAPPSRRATSPPATGWRRWSSGARCCAPLRLISVVHVASNNLTCHPERRKVKPGWASTSLILSSRRIAWSGKQRSKSSIKIQYEAPSRDVSSLDLRTLRSRDSYREEGPMSVALFCRSYPLRQRTLLSRQSRVSLRLIWRKIRSLPLEAP